jgi:hypothetical protein
MDATVQIGVLLQGVITVLVTIVVGLVTWALKRIISVDNKIDKLEMWRLGHDKQDDERHSENLGKFDMVYEALKEIQRGRNWDA